MSELQQELDRVYKLLGTVRVSGDDVEAMAAARMGLRRCYQMAQPPADGGSEREEEEG